MILIFGGTTEGKIVAKLLEQSGYAFCYSTKTETDYQPGEYRSGAFTKESLEAFCETRNIKLVIHASHPFATELHKTIHDAVKVPVLRFERTYPEHIHHPLVKYFDDYNTAINYLLHNPVRLLALTGVQTIPKLKEYWQKHYTIFRILPRESSVQQAIAAGFPEEQLLAEMPGDNNELQIIQRFDIQGIITKESGESGFLSIKIKAAQEAGIPILIIKRPSLPETFIPVHDEQELLNQLNRLLK